MGNSTKCLHLSHKKKLDLLRQRFISEIKLTHDPLQDAIENIFPDGHDYNGHLNNPLRSIWGDKELVADIYHSRDNEFFGRKELDSALRN